MPTSLRTPKLVSVRSYNQIVNLLAQETAMRIRERKMPEFVLGTPSKRMQRLADRLRRARAEVTRCEQGLKRLGAELSDRYARSLSISYQRRNVLQTQWKQHQQAALEKVQSLKLQALVDLTGADPKEAKRYLTTLRTQLGRL